MTPGEIIPFVTGRLAQDPPTLAAVISVLVGLPLWLATRAYAAALSWYVLTPLLCWIVYGVGSGTFHPLDGFIFIIGAACLVMATAGGDVDMSVITLLLGGAILIVGALI